MPQITQNSGLNTGLTEQQREHEVVQNFFKYKKIPTSIAVFCDEKRVSNIRTKIFVHNNIFGGDHLEDEVIIKRHVVIVLVDENDNAFLYNEFCV